MASAALAYERVVSTSLEFRLGTGGVTARDFLEAQTAYIDALSNVASRHIDYIVDRSRLFLDLEQLIVDETGFWPDIRNEANQPQPAYELPSWAYPLYGKLPCVWYSQEIKQMLCAPTSQQSWLPPLLPDVDTSDLEEQVFLDDQAVEMRLLDSDDGAIISSAEQFDLPPPEEIPSSQ